MANGVGEIRNCFDRFDFSFFFDIIFLDTEGSFSMISKDVYAGYYTAPEFQEAVSSIQGVILVCGSCEQHGYHLPLDTDNIIGRELALRIAEKTNMLVMPPVNYGQVWSAKGFPGTISLPPSALKCILREIICSLEQQQVKNIVLMSAHNGNYPILKDFAREIRDEFGWTNIWHFPVAFSKELEAKAQSAPAMMPHAGEAETAMMLYLRPELVHLDRAVREYPVPPEDFAYRPRHWNEFVTSGSFGDPGIATAEYGEALVEDVVHRISDLINRLL